MIRGALRRHRWTLSAILAVALFAWPFNSLTPGIGGDWSWVAALAVIAEHGPRFGDQVIFNYGPLGIFTYAPPFLYYGGIAKLAFVFQTALQLLLSGTVFLAARRHYRWPVALLVAFAVVAILPTRPFELGFAWCALALTEPGDRPPGPLSRAFPIAIGALAGVLVLGKLNLGVEILVLGAIAVAMRPARRRFDAVRFAAALLATAAIGWFATGQALGDVWPYIHYGAQVVLGYPAYAATDAGHGWHYLIALLAFVLASVLVGAAARRLSGRPRWGLVLVWLLYSFGSFKAGFVRAEAAHVWLFMGDMLIALAILPAPGPRRWPALAGVLVCVASQSLLFGQSRLDELDPLSNAKAALSETRTLVSPARLASERQAYVEAVRRTYGLPAGFVRRIDGRPVALWPYSYGDLAYAYGFDFRPVPVIEQYVAFTPPLDEATAEMLGSDRAPELIARLEQAPPSGAGFSFSDPPASLLLAASLPPPLVTRQLLCRYREVARRGRWQLLARGPDRCGAPRPIATATAPWGKPVQAPRPRPASALLVRIDGLEPGGVELVKGLLLRPDPRFALLGEAPYRVIPSLAPEGYLLAVAPGVDYPAPFELGVDASTIAVGRAGGQPGGRLRYTFLELPIDGPAGGRPPSRASRPTP